MLQSTEYQALPYLKWFLRTSNFNNVMYRRNLVVTKKTKTLIIFMLLGMLMQYDGALIAIIKSINSNQIGYALYFGALLLLTPIIWAYLILLPLFIVDFLVKKPYTALAVFGSRKIFKNSNAVKIAIAGSYGKTSMKEILLCILSESKNAVATPANKNVALAHANFAKKLKGDEEILIIEFGEGAPGDVKKFTKTIRPNYGVITGMAPAHLDKYRTLEEAGKDIFSLAKYLKTENVWINADSVDAKKHASTGNKLYSHFSAGDWKISEISITISGISFTMNRRSETIKVNCALLGEHQVGPVAAAVALSLELGLSIEQAQKATNNLKPYEHRMEPKQIGGAWVIDDTYNGNIEGMIAGLKLLKTLPAKKRIYVTPGLVDQGEETQAVHKTLGRAIATANPDKVVLMKNSVTDYIVDGMKDKRYKNELIIEDDPLYFYTNLDQVVAAGDLVLMQNDWPDNYC